MKNIGFENILYPFTDERVFPIIMQNPEICRQFLERLFPGKKVQDLHLRDEVPDLTKASSEKTLFPNVKGHGVRFDVLFEDETAWYDIEMQVRTRKDLPKRTRYYHSMMDSAFLKKGQKYNQLNPQYVIFICAYDPFGKGTAAYKFSMKDEKSGLSLGDDSFTIILNTTAQKKKVPPDLQPFFMYVSQLSVDDSDDLVRDIHMQVLELNNDSEWRDALMTWEEMLEEKLEEGYEEGFEKGHQDGIKAGIDQGLAQGLEQGLEQGIEQGKAQGIQQGIKQGIKQGKNQVLVDLVKSKKISIDVARSMSDDLVGFNELLYDESPYYIEPDYY